MMTDLCFPSICCFNISSILYSCSFFCDKKIVFEIQRRKKGACNSFSFFFPSLNLNNISSTIYYLQTAINFSIESCHRYRVTFYHSLLFLYFYLSQKLPFTRSNTKLRGAFVLSSIRNVLQRKSFDYILIDMPCLETLRVIGQSAINVAYKKCPTVFSFAQLRTFRFVRKK